MKRSPSEGIYYVVRYPNGWELVVRRFAGHDDLDHPTWWETELAGVVAARWERVLKRSQQQLLRELVLHPYGFPRGRIAAPGFDSYFVLHGANLKGSMKVTRKAVEASFGVAGQCSWHFDEHEQCQSIDQEAVCRCLRIRLIWTAV